MNKENGLSYILIPFYDSIPLQILSSPYPQQTLAADGRDTNTSTCHIGGDVMPIILQNTLCLGDISLVRVIPLNRLSSPSSEKFHFKQDYDDEEDVGLYSYSCSSTGLYDQGSRNVSAGHEQPNIRATCLAMACGLHSRRFYGDIYLSLLGYHQLPLSTKSTAYTQTGNADKQIANLSFTEDDLEFIRWACITPDLRRDFLERLENRKACTTNSTSSSLQKIPKWLTNAAKQNYHDNAAIQVLASVMKLDHGEMLLLDECDDNDSQSLTDLSLGENESSCSTRDISSCDEVETTTLCLHCRRPAKNLCQICYGVYFCDSLFGCSTLGWSHQCLCLTWSMYVQRRDELSSFPFDSERWHIPLLQRPFQLSQEPYKRYLSEELGVISSQSKPDFRLNNFDISDMTDLPSTPRDDFSNSHNFWSTEIDGWVRGGVQIVNPYLRRSYIDGFAASSKCGSRLLPEWIPPERRVSDEDRLRWMSSATGRTSRTRDEFNIVQLHDWTDYYDLRGIPWSSPIALLCTFPLTIYYAIQRFGKVHVTVATMMKRPLRIHLVGIEKELNFIDIFKEIAYILPEHFLLELVLIVRKDMFPPAFQNKNKSSDLSFALTENLNIWIKTGMYGHTIDPLWDCGTGPPDMLIGLNAGLYAYESWRYVLDFLHHNCNVTGVFTDYNEHSGLNCASLGGGKARESLSVNPFRQPRAMPVSSMNLPQFSNGFIYAFNEQELEV